MKDDSSVRWGAGGQRAMHRELGHELVHASRASGVESSRATVLNVQNDALVAGEAQLRGNCERKRAGHAAQIPLSLVKRGELTLFVSRCAHSLARSRRSTSAQCTNRARHSVRARNACHDHRQVA